MSELKTAQLIGYGVALAFVALAAIGFFYAGFSQAKALLMALTGLPLGALAPAFLEPQRA